MLGVPGLAESDVGESEELLGKVLSKSEGRNDERKTYDIAPHTRNVDTPDKLTM